MKTDQDKLELSVMVNPCKPEGSYGSQSDFYRLSFVTINAAGQVRNVSGSYGSEPFTGFSDLKFKCWISWSDGEFTARSWDIEYCQPYSVGLREAELMVKTLKRISKIQDKWIVRPQTFGQFVAMIADGLGIKRYPRSTNNNQCRSWSYDDDHFNFPEIKYLADYVDRQISDAKEAKFPTVVEEVA